MNLSKSDWKEPWGRVYTRNVPKVITRSCFHPHLLMEFISKDKFIDTRNSNLILRRDPNKDQVSVSLTIGFGVYN